jgi:hypothetical protein
MSASVGRFRAEIPLTSIDDVRPNNEWVYALGAHRWRGPMAGERRV